MLSEYKITLPSSLFVLEIVYMDIIVVRLPMKFFCDYVAVLFRVITVYPDLKPYMQEINVSISVSVFN